MSRSTSASRSAKQTGSWPANEKRICYDPPVSPRACTVSFKDVSGVRHAVEVQAESLFEAVILAVKVLKADPWIDVVGTATVFDVEVTEPITRHAVSMQQVVRWLDGGATSPNESVKKTNLRKLLTSR